MIVQSIVFINSFIFLFISIIHFYWALGGKNGLQYSIPTQEDSTTPLFQPKILGTLFIAGSFLIFTAIMLNSQSYIDWKFITQYQKPLLWFLSIIFLLRSIGEFKYVGFSKKIKNTLFAKYDTQYYSPLCFWLGCSIGYLAFV